MRILGPAKCPYLPSMNEPLATECIFHRWGHWRKKKAVASIADNNNSTGKNERQDGQPANSDQTGLARSRRVRDRTGGRTDSRNKPDCQVEMNGSGSLANNRSCDVAVLPGHSLRKILVGSRNGPLIVSSRPGSMRQQQQRHRPSSKNGSIAAENEDDDADCDCGLEDRRGVIAAGGGGRGGSVASAGGGGSSNAGNSHGASRAKSRQLAEQQQPERRRPAATARSLSGSAAATAASSSLSVVCWTVPVEHERHLARASHRSGPLLVHARPARVAAAAAGPIGKSASVPADLSAKCLVESAGKQQQQPPQGILKRSSSFFEGRSLRSLLSRRKPGSAQDLRKHQRTGKCVSFSADTSFEARPRAVRSTSTTLHESKLYRKGVLQDRNGCEERHPETANRGQLGWEKNWGGPMALLGAAQDGDDELIRRIVARASDAGIGDLDVNAVDNSGRTAISHLAGNGSALVLEACLSLRGADANLPDKEGNTPLHFAAQAGQTECLNVLLQRCPGIEVDARNSLGFTPLMKAALQGRTKCAKILLFAGANPTLRDHGRGLRAEQWARFCGRYVCAEVIERFARHRLLEKTTSCRWGSEPELAAQVFQGKLMPIPTSPTQASSGSPSGLKSKIRRVFRTTSNTDKSFSLVSQLTSAALCASSPVLPKPGDVSPVVKSLLRPLSVPQLRITLVASQDISDKLNDNKCSQAANYAEKITENTTVKPARTKKKNK